MLFASIARPSTLTSHIAISDVAWGVLGQGEKSVCERSRRIRDGMRPGCLDDASDSAQFGELDVLGELVARCRARGVQVMVEGPGHVPFDQIRANMEREQEVCAGAPFYVLGPPVLPFARPRSRTHPLAKDARVHRRGALRRPLLDVRQGVLRRAHLAPRPRPRRRALRRPLRKDG